MKTTLTFLLLISVMSIHYSNAQTCGVITDVRDGQTYQTVTIGTQCWMQENLNYGTMVADVTLQSNNSLAEKSCYNNLTADCNIYGGIYTWNEAMNYTTTQQGICPTDWHIPTKAEWTTLINYLGITVAGQHMKEGPSATIPWDGDNTSGFMAIPGGIGQGTSFMFQGSRETFWSSTEFSATEAYDYGLTTAINTLDEAYNAKPSGYCVRCIQDAGVGINELDQNLNYFSVYPNPASSTCVISYMVNQKSNVSVFIYDMLGNVAMQVSANSNQTSGEYNINADLSSIPNGIYFIQIATEKTITVQKLIINK